MSSYPVKLNISSVFENLFIVDKTVKICNIASDQYCYFRKFSETRR
jgi:hypothetical protein